MYNFILFTVASGQTLYTIRPAMYSHEVVCTK